jgi:hypothetical protein
MLVDKLVDLKGFLLAVVMVKKMVVCLALTLAHC